MRLKDRITKTAALLALMAGSACAFEQGAELPRPDADGQLVRAGRYTLRPVALAEETAVLIFYYSASWCAPCKRTGQKLAETYPAFQTRAPGLEFVTYSMDVTPHARADHLRQTRYPWPAIAPAALDDAPWELALKGGTPQFQAFEVHDEKIVALTPPGAAGTTIEAALAYLQKRDRARN